MKNLTIVHRNPDPERRTGIATSWQVDRQDGSSRFWDRWQIEENDRRHHPRDGAVEKIISATYRIVENRH